MQSFSLSSTEFEVASKWMNKHLKKCKLNPDRPAQRHGRYADHLFNEIKPFINNLVLN